MDLSSTPVQIPHRVLIFSFVYFPRLVGGAEVAVKEITNRINPREVSFSLIALQIDNDLPKEERIGKIDVYRVGFTVEQTSKLRPFVLKINKLLYPLFAVKKAMYLHRKLSFNTNWALMANYSGFAALFFKFIYSKVPFVLTLQEGDPIEWILQRVRFVMPLFKKIFTHANHVQAISNYLADFAHEMGTKSENISVVPNGVDVAYFSQMFPQSELDKILSELNRKENEKFIITTSRLVHKNGIDSVIKSLKYVESPVRFLIVGRGPDEEMLRELVASEGVSHKVVFVGFVPHEELPKYLRISDVFIRPSRSEGFGNSFVEAMAAGVPVIATPVGGIPDFIIDKKTGLFTAVDDSVDIAHKIEILLRDISLSKEIVAEAKKMVKEKYDWNTISKDMEAILLNK